MYTAHNAWEQYWLLDLGPMSHMTNDGESFIQLNEQRCEYVTIVNGKWIKLLGVGVVLLKCCKNSATWSTICTGIDKVCYL